MGENWIPWRVAGTQHIHPGGIAHLHPGGLQRIEQLVQERLLQRPRK